MSTSVSYSSIITKVYKSRNILLEIFKSRGYKTTDYEGFSVNDVHAMYNSIPKQLDMMLEHNDNTKLYIKYHLGTKLKQNHIDDTIEDLYEIEEILTNKDELIVICKVYNSLICLSKFV